jgi:hypothetical protein
VPGTYFRLAADVEAKFGHKPVIHNGTWRQTNASRYIREFQSRRSLLTWKIFGKRMDGWSNDDFPTETVAGDASTLQLKGQPVANTPQNRNLADLDFAGSIMPPPDAVAGTYKGPDGKPIKVAPLSDEDRLTIVRWIDLGCPIDLDHDPRKADSRRGLGWMLDDHRPTLALTYPRPNGNESLSRIVIGMHDYYTGLNMDTFEVRADFAVNGVAAGQNLSAHFKPIGPNIWELRLTRPIDRLPRGTLTVSVRDKEWNLTRIERVFWVGR